jgi:hypothetical protein
MDFANQARERAKFEMQRQNFELDLQDRVMEQSRTAATDLASGLIQLDENFEPIEPSLDQINELATEMGIDPIVLMGEVNKRTDAVREMGREERSFLLDEQINQATLQEKNFRNQRDAIMLPYDIQNKIVDVETGEANLERVKFLTDKEKAMLPFDMRLKSLQVENAEMASQQMLVEMQQKQEQARNEAVGILSFKDQQQIDKSPQGENLRSLSNLKVKMQNYRNLVDEYGTAKISPTQKRLLDQAQNEALIAWKTAAELGALQGPDLMLAEKSVPRATPDPEMGAIGKIFFSPTNNAAIKKTLDASIGTLEQNAQREIQQLQARGDKWFDNQYTYSLMNAFDNESIPTMYHNYESFSKTAEPGEVEEFTDFLLRAGIPESDPETIEEALQIFRGGSGGFNQPLSMGVNGSELGQLSAQFESSGDPGAIGYDRTGGYSFGTYQLAHGNAAKFLEQSRFRGEFGTLDKNSKEFQNTWKRVAQENPQEFEREQHEFIKQTHFDPQVQKLASAGVNLGNYSPVMQQVVWSTSVQHGAGTNVITKTFNKLGPNASEEDLIREIYSERATRFGGSTPAVRQSVRNRFKKEKQLALKALA